MPSRRSLLCTLVAVSMAGVLLVGCSSGSDSSASTTASTTTTTTAPSPTPTSARTTSSAPTSTASTPTTVGSTTAPTTVVPAKVGCTSGAAGTPAGAHTKGIVDVDGDGRRDIAWVTEPAADTGTTTFGISTAAGGRASTAVRSASPVERSALVVNADQRGPVEMIVSDGRSAGLYAFSGCAIKPILNPQGRDYSFDLFGARGPVSGVGCIATPSGRRLVGLDSTVSADGSTVRWSRTIIELQGLRAQNGATTRGILHDPADEARIQLLHTITCADLTMARDGVSDRSG